MGDQEQSTSNRFTLVTGGGLDLISADENERGDFTGRYLDDFLIGELLGSGGFGEVYMAEQLAPVMRTVALKVLKPGMDSQAVLSRFELERQTLARMEHRNVATMFSAGTTPNGRPFFVMELVRGSPITQYCDDRRISVSERVELMLQVCSAVQHAHQKGVVHRDLKPSNVLVTEIDGQPVPKVIDFGIAKATHDALVDTHEPTRVGELIGTPSYMSPEQASGDPLDIDTRTDVYTLGVLLYQLVTGALPFVAQLDSVRARHELLRMICEDEPVRPSVRVQSQAVDHPITTGSTNSNSLSRQIRGDLDWIILKALSKPREHRYESASALALDIQRHLRNEPILARSPRLTYRIAKFARRHTIGLATVGAVAVGLVGGLLYVNAKRAEAVAARDDLAKVARFQEGMLDVVRPQHVARRLREDLRRRIRVAAENDGVPETAIENQLAAFDSAISDVNLADVSKTVIHENILVPSIQELASDYQEEPLLDAQLRRRIGQVYLRLSMYEEARQQMELSLIARERVLGRYHPDTISSRKDLGLATSELGRYDEAEVMYRQVLEDSRKALGNTHPETLTAMHNLASATRRRGDLEAAEDLTREAVAGSKQQFGEDDPRYLGALHGMGAFLRSSGKLREAADYYRRVLEGRRRVLGDEHRDTLVSTNNLAFVLQHLGEFEGADPLFREALDVKRRVLGNEHRSTLISMNNLAMFLRVTGDVPEAELLLQESLRTSEKTLGDDHPDTLLAARSLAYIAFDTADYERAAKQFGEVARRQAAVIGPDRAETLWTRRQVGKSLEGRGRLDEAEAELRSVFSDAATSLGESHPDTLDHQMLLGEFLLRRQRHSEAYSILRGVVELSTTSLGSAHRKSVEADVLLGRALIGQGQFSEAERKLAQTTVQAEQLPSFQNRTLARAKREWGRALVGLGELERAKVLLSQAHVIFDDRVDDNARDLALMEVAFAELEQAQ